MIEGIVGSRAAEFVLIFLSVRGSGYSKEIADFFGIDRTQIKKQLDRMERESVLVSRSVGRTRVFEFNPRFLFRGEVEALMLRVLESYPESIREDLKFTRKRPRRTGKPL